MGYIVISPSQTKIMNLKTLKDIRKMRKITIKQLAKQTGLNDDRISLIERGKVNPSFETVIKIAEGLNCKIVITI